MNENARFYITIGVYMAISFSTGYTTVDKLSIILEIYSEQFFSTFKTADFTNFVIHVCSLLRSEQQLSAGVDTYRHVMEIPGEYAAFIYKHI